MRPKGIVQTTNEKGSARLGRSEDNAEGQADFEMANLRPERTGLPLIVFISQKGGARHDVRIKVARAARVRPSEMVTVAIGPSIRVVRGRLDAHDVALLTQWIDQGADYQMHWSYLPPRRPPLPAVKNAGWVRNGIDHFILQRLEKAGLLATPGVIRLERVQLRKIRHGLCL